MKGLALLVGLVVLISGGAGAWYFFDLETALFGAPAPVSKKKKAEPLPPEYTDLQVMVIPIIRRERVHRSLQVQVVIESEGKANQAIVSAHTAELRDAFIRELNTYINLQYDESNQPEIENVKKRLKLIGDRVLGQPGAISQILLPQFYSRRP